MIFDEEDFLVIPISSTSDLPCLSSVASVQSPVARALGERRVESLNHQLVVCSGSKGVKLEKRVSFKNQAVSGRL